MYDKLASLLNAAVVRWTSKSPRAARIVTDVSVIVGVAATIATLLPLSYPAWVIPAAAFSIAFASKFTVEK